jgi:hypothetical protein
MTEYKAGLPLADQSLLYLSNDILLVQVDGTRRAKLYSNGHIRYNRQRKTLDGKEEAVELMMASNKIN